MRREKEKNRNIQVISGKKLKYTGEMRYREGRCGRV